MALLTCALVGGALHVALPRDANTPHESRSMPITSDTILVVGEDNTLIVGDRAQVWAFDVPKPWAALHAEDILSACALAAAGPKG